MFNIILLFFMINMIIITITIIYFLISTKMKIMKEKMYSYECGFNQFSSPRMPFSLRFFLITVIFLIFDIEIALIMPMINTFLLSNLMDWFLTITIIILILIMGLIHEWNQGSLNWM